MPPVTTNVPVPVLVLAVPWVIVTAPLAATAPVPTDPVLAAPLTPIPPVTTMVPVDVLVEATFPVNSPLNLSTYESVMLTPFVACLNLYIDYEIQLSCCWKSFSTDGIDPLL